MTAFGSTRQQSLFRRRGITWLLLGVPTLFMVVFLLVPIGGLFVTSLQERTADGTAWTVDNYVVLFTDSIYVGPLMRTLRVSLLATFVCMALAYPTAILLNRCSPRARAYGTLILFAPLLSSVVVRSFGWMIILGPSGAIDEFIEWLGIGGIKPILYSETAIVIGLVHVFVAFMVVTILASIDDIDPAVYSAAKTLGSGPLRTFWRVTVPLTGPGLLGGSVIVFALSASSFITPRLLGGARNQTLAGVVYDQAMVTLNWPIAAAAAFILLAAIAVLYYGAGRLFPSSTGGRTL